MKTRTLIAVVSLTLAPVIFAAEPPKPLSMHLVDRGRIQTNAPPTYRVSVAYDLTDRVPLRFDYAVETRTSHLRSRP